MADQNRYDFALLNNDLVFSSGGDLIIQPSDEQHIEDVIQSFPGWWKEFPNTGVGLFSWLGSSFNPQALARVIRIQLQLDGYNNAAPTFNLDPNGNYIINPGVKI